VSAEKDKKNLAKKIYINTCHIDITVLQYRRCTSKVYENPSHPCIRSQFIRHENNSAQNVGPCLAFLSGASHSRTRRRSPHVRVLIVRLHVVHTSHDELCLASNSTNRCSWTFNKGRPLATSCWVILSLCWQQPTILSDSDKAG
jgi:hypothetical protein